MRTIEERGPTEIADDAIITSLGVMITVATNTRSEMTARTNARHEEARRLRKLGLPSKGVASRLAPTPSEVSRWLRKYDDVPHARFFTREEDLALIAGP